MILSRPQSSSAPERSRAIDDDTQESRYLSIANTVIYADALVAVIELVIA
jgi:hypothetical protein